jgi:hypothetical protein
MLTAVARDAAGNQRTSSVVTVTVFNDTTAPTASYYAAGHSFCVDPGWMNDFGLGNNGQQGASDTGQYWYFSAVEIRTDRWPGAVQ